MAVFYAACLLFLTTDFNLESFSAHGGADRKIANAVACFLNADYRALFDRRG